MSLITTGLKATSLDARVLKTYDNGTSFINEYTSTARATDSNRNWYSVASSEDGTKLVAVVSGEYIYTSPDSGVNWTARTIAGIQDWESVASSADGTKLVAVVDGEYIYTSTDSGASWTQRVTSGSRSWKDVASSADGTKLVAVANNNYIYTSTDSGVNWTQRMTDSVRTWKCVASSADGTKLVAGVYDGFIYTSIDSGESWEAKLFDTSREWTSVASSADGTKLVVGGSFVNIYTSTNMGDDWIVRDVGAKWWNSIASSSDGTKLIAAEYEGQIYTSMDSGESWVARDINRNWFAVASSADGIKLVAVVSGGGVIYTIDIAPFRNSLMSIGTNKSTIASSGTVATVNTAGINILKISATSATTITDSAALYIAGPPIAGTNLTITNLYALNVASGNSRFGGNSQVDGTSRFVGDSQFDGISRFESSTQSTSSSTGAIVCRGGIGLGMGSTGAPPIISWGNNYTVSASNSKQIALYETNSGNLFQYYGFGVSSGQLCYTVDSTSSDHVFFAAANASSRTELLRIKGNGDTLVGAGGIAFLNDTTTGFYRIGASNVGFVAAGTLRWEYNSSRINSTIPIHLLNGSASAPSLSFTNDGSQDTGLYWISDGNVGFTSNGTKRWEYNNTRINSDVRIDASAGIQLKGTGAGGYNGIMTVGNTQNNSSARWGQIYHIAVDSTATSTILATIQSSGLYGGGYLEVILCGTHNTVSGISAKAEIYIAMDGGSITLNTAGGTNRKHPGTFNIAYVGSANQGTLSTLNSKFISTSLVEIELVTSSQPVNYDIYVRAFFGGSSANTFTIF